MRVVGRHSSSQAAAHEPPCQAAGYLLTVADDLGGTTTHSYDAVNRRIETTQSGTNVADKHVDFGYDNAGRLVSVDRYADLQGQETNLVAATDYAYDAVDQMTGLTHTADGPPSVYTWEYDEAGRLLYASSPDGEVDYTHDDTDQLTSADYSAQDDEAYAYDAAGNRTGGGYDVDPNNRLAFDGTYTYEYDDEGNLVTRTAAGGARREFEWDYRRRLTSVTDYAADDTVVQQVLFTYDALDNRLTKTVDPDD